MKRVAVSAVAPEARVVEAVAETILAGGVAAVPTDTLYGLAVDPFNRDAVARLFLVKRRSLDRGIPLIAADTAQVLRTCNALSRLGARLADRFWPGPLTLLLPAPVLVAEAVTGGTDRIGIRVPDHPVARLLCSACGRPLTATSANVSGEEATADPDVVARALEGAIDVLLDAGRTPGGEPSTIVDVTSDAPRLVRAGAISWGRIEECLRLP